MISILDSRPLVLWLLGTAGASIVPCATHGQDSLQVESIILRIGEIHLSDSSTYFFSLDSIPDEVLTKIISNAVDGARVIPIKRFIADHDEDYEATDDIHDQKTPQRKLLFGQRLGHELIFFYYHGGRGKHLHVVYAQLGSTPVISSFVTLRNMDSLNGLERRWETPPKITLRLPVVFHTDMKALSGKVYDEFDLF